MTTLTRITYKIVVDPKTYDFVVNEIEIHEERGHRWIETRPVEIEELSTWTKVEFMNRMSEHGYGSAAKSYLERHAIDFSCGQQP